MRSSDSTSPTRRLRILFFLMHAGYLRHYSTPVSLLAERGHAVHLALTRPEKEPGDRELVEELLRAHPGRVTVGPAPQRSDLDGWRRVSSLVRAFTDLARYAHPRYAESAALKGRMARKVRAQIESGKSDPLSRALLLRAARRLASTTDERLATRVRRLLEVLERAIPTSTRIDGFVRSFEPDVVLAATLVEYASNQVDYVKSAQRLGIPTAVCIASWDNLSNKGLIRVVPDRVVVWNERQVRELEELHGIPAERAVVTGAQRFDEWFEREPSTTPAQFKRRVGLDPDLPYVLYLCSSSFVAPEEVGFVRRWLAALRGSDAQELETIGVLVRPHPQNTAQWRGVDLHEFGSVVVWPPQGAQPDTPETRDEYFDSLAHAAAVVGVNTSAMIEAGIVGKSVFSVLDPVFAATQEGTLHFRHLLYENGGFLNVAPDLDQHVSQLVRALRGAEAHRAQTLRFVEEFVRPHGLDVPAAPLVADAVESLAREPAAAARMPLRLLPLRALLLVPAGLAALSTLVGIAARGRRPAHRPALEDRATAGPSPSPERLPISTRARGGTRPNRRVSG